MKREVKVVGVQFDIKSAKVNHGEPLLAVLTCLEHVSERRKGLLGNRKEMGQLPIDNCREIIGLGWEEQADQNFINTRGRTHPFWGPIHPAGLRYLDRR
jgi:hypothetical protein